VQTGAKCLWKCVNKLAPQSICAISICVGNRFDFWTTLNFSLCFRFLLLCCVLWIKKKG